MSKNYELDYLKSQEQAAFARQQSAWQNYANAKQRANEAHDEMESAWEERRSAREEMNREYELMEQSSERYREVWDEYGRIRDNNNSRIDDLRQEADYEHAQMVQCFEEASSEYEYGDKSLAPVYSQEGREHKARRDDLNAEISSLIQEIKTARDNAEWRAPKTSSDAFHRAKDLFEQAKLRHEVAQTEFKRLKAERDHCKTEFEDAKKEHDELKEEFQRKLEEVKRNNARERERTLDRAGVKWSERSDAKIVKKADGTTQIYHGGLGNGDGLGHGHTALDRNGNKTYDRDAFAKHGSQNYTDKKKDGWYPIVHGTIEGHEVTLRQGKGKNKGQTIITDGYVSGKELNRHHNHYGDNDKNRYPNQPDRIENSDAHKNDHYYTGPGH